MGNVRMFFITFQKIFAYRSFIIWSHNFFNQNNKHQQQQLTTNPYPKQMMNSNIILTLLFVGFTQAFEATSSDFFESLTKPESLCATDSSYNPVVCTTFGDEDGTTRREIHQNACAARLIGAFQDHENDCTCYEFEEIVSLMAIHFGEGKCQFITPRPVNERDAQVWYSCHTDDNTDDNFGDESEGTEPDRILSAKLVASGILGDAPMPLYFTIDLNVENQPSRIAMLPSSNSFGFQNDCTDYERADMFLRVYS